MSKSGSNVRVALEARIQVRDVKDSNTPVTACEGDIDGAVDLGYTDKDGIKFSIKKETKDIESSMTSVALRTLITSSPTGVSFTLAQTDRLTWLTSMGGTITKTDDGLYMWEPDESSLVEREVYIDFSDGKHDFRFGFRRAQQVGDIEMALTREDALTFPNDWKVLAAPKQDQKPWFVLTNSPAFEGTPA